MRESIYGHLHVPLRVIGVCHVVVTMWPRVYACVCAIASGDENLARSPSYEGKPTSLSRVRRARLGAARGRCARKCSAGPMCTEVSELDFAESVSAPLPVFGTCHLC